MIKLGPKTIFLSVLLPLFMISFVCAAAPDIVSRQKNTVVTVYVDDTNNNHVESGSGFIVDPDGVIVTNCRVIAKWFKETGATLHIEMEDGVRFPIEELISSKCENNLALFKIKAKDLPAVKLARDSVPGPGEKIAVIKKMPGSEAVVAGGAVRSVNGKSRSFRVSTRATAANSVSPVFNMKGEVVGAVIVQPRYGKSLGLAVSIEGISKQLRRYIRPKALAGKSIRQPETKRETGTIGKDVDDTRLYFSRGLGFDHSGMYKEAIDAYEQLLKVKPDFTDAYVNLGVDYYELGEYENAVNAFKQAIRLKPGLLTAYNKLGSTYIIRGEYSRAIDTFKQVIRVDPNNASAHFNLGIAYLLNGDGLSAREEYQILKGMDRKRAESLFDLIN